MFYLCVTLLDTVFYYFINKANSAVFLNYCPYVAVAANTNTGVALTKIAIHQNLMKIILYFLTMKQSKRTKFVQVYILRQVLLHNSRSLFHVYLTKLA